MRKKVLIIVGGGAYGCVPAHFLSMLPEDMANLNRVDCLSGCSIGGILAAAYAAGGNYKFIDEFFQEHAKDCFDKRFIAKINPLACPTYSSDGLNKMLKEILGKKTMADTRNLYPQLDLFIPALNITDDKYKVFDNIDDLDTKLTTVAAITSAAPSYYPGICYQRKCYIDGGLIEVAPLITATTALRGKRDIKFEDMDVLMLGTGRDIADKPLTTKDYNDLSLLGLALNVVVPYATLANELATVYWGKNMGFNSFEYFNPCTHNGVLDDTSQVPEMVEQCEKYRSEFLDVYNKWIEK